MRPAICGTSAGRRSSVTCRASVQRKIKREIIQFYQIHHASYLHLLILILSLLSSAHRSSLVLSNVCPSCVLLPSALMRTAAVACNTNCYLTLCLCFFPASHGSLGPIVFSDLHSCSDKRKELVYLTKQWHRQDGVKGHSQELIGSLGWIQRFNTVTVTI